MQIAQILSGYSLGEADMLRRAMGKKIKAEMDAQRDRFVRGAVEREIPKPKANEIFDLLAKFADYGFNKSHAAAYALIAYQTGWFKANYPVEFLAASMTLDKANTDKLAEFRNEAQRLGIKVEPPSINESESDFAVRRDTNGELYIRYALSAVKGVGEGQAQAIVDARGETPFRDFGDFANRIDPRAINRKVLENLGAAGAFDVFEKERARAIAAIDTVLAQANRTQAEALAGQSALFGDSAASFIIPKAQPWPPSERLRRGVHPPRLFLPGPPLRGHHQGVGRVQGPTSGSKMGIVTLSDPSGQYEAILFQEGLNQYRDFLEKGSVVMVAVQASLEGEDVRARIATVEPLDRAASKVQKGLRIFMRDGEPLASVAQRLGTKGEGEVSFVLMLERERSEVEIRLPGRFHVSPQIAGAIKAIPGIVAVEHI